MLSASAVAALSVCRIPISELFAPIGLHPCTCGRPNFAGHPSLTNSFINLIGSLHAPLRLAFLPLLNHPPIPHPLPRCPFGHSSAHSLCLCLGFHLLPPYHLPHLYPSKFVLQGNLSPVRLVSFLHPRHRKGPFSHRTSLRRAHLRERRHRIRMATLDQRTRSP